MSAWRSMLPRRRVRIVLYVLILLAVLWWRDPRGWRSAPRPWSPRDSAAPALVVAGDEVAPEIVDALLRAYVRDYPQVTVALRGGGSAHALQGLLDGEVTIGWLTRPLLSRERRVFLEGDLEIPIVEPVALGAILILRSAQAGSDVLSCSELRALLRGEERRGIARVYSLDPNLGIEDALRISLALGVEKNGGGRASVFYVRDQPALLEALRADHRALGIASSLMLNEAELLPDLRLAAIASEDSSEAVLPTYENVGYGRYPLLHHLFVACRADARGEPSKFLTFVSSARGQRLVERAGYLPARRPLREILLRGEPIGTRR